MGFSPVHTGAQANSVASQCAGDTQTDTHKYSKNIFEKNQKKKKTQFYPKLSEIVVLNYQEQLINCVQVQKGAISVVAAFF